MKLGLISVVVGSTFPDYSGVGVIFMITVLAGVLGLAVFVGNLIRRVWWLRTAGALLGLVTMATTAFLWWLFADSGQGFFFLILLWGFAQVFVALFGPLRDVETSEPGTPKAIARRRAPPPT